jgi:hypothetical protein
MEIETPHNEESSQRQIPLVGGALQNPYRGNNRDIVYPTCRKNR